jgi:hypothetical protein
MAWTTLTDSRDQIDDKISSFAGTVSSIDRFSAAGHGTNQVTVLIEYTP